MWHVGKVMALHDETATTRTITLEVPGWPGHIAGQHVDVRVTAADGYSAARSYSIASAPNVDGRIELTIERLPDGEVSPYLTQELTVGDPLELRGPLGGWFVWRANQTEAIQLIAGGSGIVLPPDILVRRIQVFERIAIVGPAPKPKNAFRLR
jgi:ferredoxin-NADP reductase